MKRSVAGIVLFSDMMFFLSMIVLGAILSGTWSRICRAPSFRLPSCLPPSVCSSPCGQRKIISRFRLTKRRRAHIMTP